ncbi:MAG: hypothetical protein H8E61_07140, partial [Bacteroidetes bacterium]|nr:hypothetical protein [Bacteroidota bacterium]
MNDKVNIKTDYQKLIYENRERLKELSTINKTTSLIREGKSMDETLKHICMILPAGWQYPEFTCARIKYDELIFSSNGFKESPWFQKAHFDTLDKKRGIIEIFYSREFAEMDEGPF